MSVVISFRKTWAMLRGPHSNGFDKYLLFSKGKWDNLAQISKLEKNFDQRMGSKQIENVSFTFISSIGGVFFSLDVGLARP